MNRFARSEARHLISEPSVPPRRVDPTAIRSSIYRRALCFALGACIIGLVVLPTAEAERTGVATTHFVTGRLFWGAAAVALICLLTRPEQLARPWRDHIRFARNGVLIGWMPVFLYTVALNGAAVAPVIVTLVGSSAIIGTLLESAGRLRVGHLFVLTAFMVGLAGVVFSSAGYAATPSWAWVAAAGAGVAYGLLPVLCRSESTATDLGSVAYYLGVGCAASALWALAVSPEGADPLGAALLSPASIVAGVLCTGLGYALFQFGISPDRDGRRVGTDWATFLYGCEPAAAIIAAGLWLGQPFTLVNGTLIAGFLVLVTTAGPVLRQVGAEPVRVVCLRPGEQAGGFRGR